MCKLPCKMFYTNQISIYKRIDLMFLKLLMLEYDKTWIDIY